MKKEFDEYFLGIDAGSDSVGWAVTDKNYNLLKLNGKDMWGIRLFDAGESAAQRRAFRTARRRQGRRVQRTKLLQELFSEEISKCDMSFYKRMEESKFLEKDKALPDKGCLFSNFDYTDKDYHKAYPTIYHLRQAFVNGERITDVRLLYLAVHHIISNRGHFLFEGMNFGNITQLDLAFKSLNESLFQEFGFDFSFADLKALESVLKEKSGISVKKKVLYTILSADTQQSKAIADLLAGAAGIKLSVLFDDVEYEESELNKITFSSEKLDENYDAISNLLQDRIVILDWLKAVYDWGVLNDILNGSDYILYAKVKTFEKHKKDLAILKRAIKMTCPEKYIQVFKAADEKSNYCAYSGICKIKGKKVPTAANCNQAEFIAFVKSVLKNADSNNPDVGYIKSEIEKGTFMPKQTSANNGVIPYQVNLKELICILDNAKEEFPFLNEKDDNGMTCAEKIIKLFTFRIPYFVGPLNDSHPESGNCWIVKKSSERITPWNFDEIVDLPASGEKFILRMTNKCTYLVGEDVLPKESLLFSEYNVLNSLNKLKLNGEAISVKDKQNIYTGLFCKKNKVRIKDICHYYQTSYGVAVSPDDFTGTDGDFKASLKSLRDFTRIMGENFKSEPVEDAIQAVTIFGNDRKMLKTVLSRIQNGYFTDEQMNQICKLSYAGWGSFSAKLLTGIVEIDTKTGECHSIIEAMRETNENFMQLLGKNHGFTDAINEYNAEITDTNTEFTYDNLVRDIYASPAVKRSLWQILLVTNEIKKIIGHAPKKIFMEMAREEQEKKRTETRKTRLLEMYRSCKSDTRDWAGEISAHSDGDLRRDALYLYYTQMGRCMYSGEPIDLDRLYDKNVYDIDHIYPQSKVKDDSLDNRVLVKKQLNSNKSDRYPIPAELLTEDAKKLWKLLMEKKFISAEKYRRLVRREGFSDSELEGFISRQLVETRQSTKAAAQILAKVYPDTRLVYSKAANVNVFKQKYNFVKVREVNDYHHAKDAYLNIVVGNVFDVKFTANPYNIIKNREKYSLNDCMYDYRVERSNCTAWIPGDDGTIATVKKIYNKNRILHTRYAFVYNGEFYKQQPLPKGDKKLVPLKQGDERFRTADYGGYQQATIAYFALVAYEKKGKSVRSLESIPTYLSKYIEENPAELETYLKKELNVDNVDVRLRKIKKCSLLKYNGFPLHITGRSNNTCLGQCAAELILDDENYRYTKNVVKFVARQKKAKIALEVTTFDGITAEGNIRLYDALLQKLSDSVFRFRPNNQKDTLEKGRDRFVQLSPRKQAEVLCEVLHLFQCNSVDPNFALIGGSARSGIIQISKMIKSKDKFYLIHQSVTGVFEQVIDLATV